MGSKELDERACNGPTANQLKLKESLTSSRPTLAGGQSWGGGSWAELAVGGDFKMHMVVLGTGSALPRIQVV